MSHDHGQDGRSGCIYSTAHTWVVCHVHILPHFNGLELSHSGIRKLQSGFHLVQHAQRDDPRMFSGSFEPILTLAGLKRSCFIVEAVKQSSLFLWQFPSLVHFKMPPA